MNQPGDRLHDVGRRDPTRCGVAGRIERGVGDGTPENLRSLPAFGLLFLRAGRGLDGRVPFAASTRAPLASGSLLLRPEACGATAVGWHGCRQVGGQGVIDPIRWNSVGRMEVRCDQSDKMEQYPRDKDGRPL
jgi:hypothetical protein